MRSTVELEEEKQKRDSMALSLIIHAFLLLFFLFPIFSFYNKQPEPPRFQGVEVVLGTRTSENSERTPASQAPQASAPLHSRQAVKPKPAKRRPKSSSKAIKIESQTLTAVAPVIATKKKVIDKKVAKANTDEAETKKKAEEAEQLKAQQEAAAKAEQLAQEAARKAAAERAAQKAAAEAKKNAARSKFNNLMKSTTSTATGSMGDPNGKPDASALEGMTTGKGQAGNGIGDRGLIYSPAIEDNTQKTGRVVVNICVNAQGKVHEANFTQKGSTTTDSYLIDLAVKSAKKYRFTESKAVEQCGDIIIDFRLK